jgi:hypothetical protein
MMSLVITFLVCGKLNSVVLGRFGLWLENKLLEYTNRERFLSVKEISISRFCAVMMALGFTVIGLANNCGIILLGESCSYINILLGIFWVGRLTFRP